MTTELILTGSGKGGGSQRAPVEAENDLFSNAVAKVIDLLGEGEMYGLSDRTNPQKCIYFDDVALMNSDGSFNFEGVTIQERLGTPDQTPATGFSEIESTISINQEVTDVASPQWVVSDTDIDAIRVVIRVPALYTQDLENGDLLRHSVGLKIEVKQNDEASWDEIINTTIEGKTNSPYQRAYHIPLSGYSGTDYPLTVKVTRTTEESEASTTQDSFFVDNYVEIQEEKLSYPDSAYVAITINAEQFGDRIPRRSYKVKGLKIQYPSNYDPDTREYTGLWDGTFLEGWCNNPAWVLYDVLTNTRYGLGNDILPSQVDKAALYSIGVYCDEMVDDGKGGQEPRFAINAVINERKEAFTVINAIVTVFRGMAFWSAGGVSFSGDMPKDAVRVVTPANVLNGDFNRSGIALKARHSAVLVTWNDPEDLYKQAIEVVEDANLIDRLGWQQLEVVAFGTTSRAQAIRMGKWILDSEANETETITFTAGFDHADVRPGDILKISDPVQVGARLHGRVMASSIKDLKPSTVTDTFMSGETFSCVTVYSGPDEVDRDNDATFHCQIHIPSDIKPVGVIWEAGDSTSSGAYLGFNGNGDLVLRAGDGGSSPVANDVARLVITNAQLERGRDLDLLWDIRVDPGRVRLWVNNRYLGEAGTANGSDLLNGEWANSNAGGYGTVGGSATVAGETGSFSQDVTDSGVLLKSVLTYYRNDFIWTPSYNHTTHQSFLPGAVINASTTDTPGAMDRDNQAIIWFAFKTPAAGTGPEGCLFELGKGTSAAQNAAYIGFDGNYDLVFHFGQGGATPDVNEHVRIIVPAEYFSADTIYHVMVNLVPKSGYLAVWINHKFYESAYTEDFSGLMDDAWAGTEDGKYGGVEGSTLIDLTGNYDQDFNGTLVSSLDYNRNGRLTEGNNGFYYGSVTLDQAYEVQPGDQLLVQTADSRVDVLDLHAGTDTSVVYVVDHPTKDIVANAVFILKGQVEPEEVRALNNKEVDTHQYEITCLKYDRTKFDRVETGIVVPAAVTSLLPSGALLPPTNLSFLESLYTANNGVHTRIMLSWSHSADPRTRLYRVEAQSPTGNWRTYENTAVSSMTIEPAEAGVWSFRVTSLTSNGAVASPSSSASLLSQTVVGKTAPPGDVSNLTASRGYASVTLTWDRVTDLDLVGYEVRRGTDWENATVVTDLMVGTHLTVLLDTTANVTFLVKAVDELQLESVNATAVTTSIKALPTITGFSAVQLGSDIKLQWDPVLATDQVQFQLRRGTTSSVWNTSFKIAETSNSYHTFTQSVSASTTFRLAIKPFVELDEGARVYGPEVTFTHEQHPVIGANLVKTQNEHTTWGGRTVSAPTATADESIASSTNVSSVTTYFTGQTPPQIDRNNNATFRVTLKVPTGVNPVGSIFEMGGTTKGVYVGFDGNYDLVLRCGYGGSSWASNPNAICRMVIPNASIPSNVDFDLMWDIRVGSEGALMKCWIDDVLMDSDATDDGSDFTSSAWTDNDEGRFNGIYDDSVQGEAGSYTQAVTTSGVLIQSNLEYWHNTLVDDPLEITGSDELALKAGYETGVYRYDFTHASEKFGRLFNSFTALWLSDTELKINDATMEINDATFPITPDLNDDTIPQISLVIYSVDGTVVNLPFTEELDLKFTTIVVQVTFQRRLTDDNRPALSALTTYFDEPSTMR